MLTKESIIKLFNKDSMNHWNNMSEELQLLAINVNPYIIKHIRNPSKNVQKRAMYWDSQVFTHIENPTDESQLKYIDGNPFKVRYIKNPSDDVLKHVMNICPDALDHFHEPSEELKKRIFTIKVSHNAEKNN